jgi:hypothetical protein
MWRKRTHRVRQRNRFGEIGPIFIVVKESLAMDETTVKKKIGDASVTSQVFIVSHEKGTAGMGENRALKA